MSKLSTSQRTSSEISSVLTPETYTALWSILNKARMLNGWTTRTAKELDATIETWGEMLDHYRIPVSTYPELYVMAFDRRQEILREKGTVIQMDAPLLVSCWTGEYGLKAQLQDREIAAGRMLTGQATSHCTKCFGTGVENLRDATGNIIGARLGCDHEYVEGFEATVADVEKAQAAAHVYHDETAEQILKRLSAQIAYEWAQAIPGTIESSDLWNATACLRHAERYCRQQEDHMSPSQTALHESWTDMAVEDEEVDT